MQALIDEGEIEEVRGEGEGDGSEVRYRRVPPVPELGADGRRHLATRRAAGARRGRAAMARLAGEVVDFGVTKPEFEERQLQSDLEKLFAEFFDGVVSEWNPCFTEDGRWRYKWDDEIGAHNVVYTEEWREMDPLDEGDLLPEEQKRWEEVEKNLTAEERAVHAVSAREPDRVCLRGLLDKVYAAKEVSAGNVDVQRVRRLVAALVNRVARHTKHGHDAPTLGVHACARGKDGCPVCRYGFPRERFPRGGQRRMAMEKGALEGQWHAKFPRNDRLCCSYEAHVLMANMGNIDWRPVLNLWAVVQYVTKYATKAPKGTRRLQEVLKDAVDEVCQYVPEGEGSDFLRRSIQKFFARSLGERDYHAYEVVQLGLQLPLVIPMMPIISLNTTGTAPVKPYYELHGPDKDDTPVHYDSRVDKFDKRRKLVQDQLARGDDSIKPEEVKHLSLFEFWWKYSVYKGRVRRSTRPVCLMVTPCFSADCANVEHANHEGYARAAVIAYWRHMARDERLARITAVDGAKSVNPVCFGETSFEQPWDNEGRYLGVRDLYMKFGAPEKVDGWGMALMEMLTDPLLLQWVPEWVVEQYRRANPFFWEVLTAMVAHGGTKNNRLLRRTKKEMVSRHHRQLVKDAAKKERAKARAKGCDVATSDVGGTGDDGGVDDSGVDEDKDADQLAAKLAGERDEDPNDDRVEMEREERPRAGPAGETGEQDVWARRTAAERLSAAGQAPQARDRVLGADDAMDVSGGAGFEQPLGVIFNPKDFPWTEQRCNVHWSEEGRLKKQQDEWYGKAHVGDGADTVDRSELDAWQKFAHDIVMDSRFKPTCPLRLMLLGSAGTGKSRTVRSFVGSRRAQVRRLGEPALERARLRGRHRGEAEARRAHTPETPCAVTVAEMLGVSMEEAADAVSAYDTAHAKREKTRKTADATVGRAEEKAVAVVQHELETRAQNSCLLAAPTGCASFQLKFGASTLHRAFGVPVGFCGSWGANRAWGSVPEAEDAHEASKALRHGRDEHGRALDAGQDRVQDQGHVVEGSGGVARGDGGRAAHDHGWA